MHIALSDSWRTGLQFDVFTTLRLIFLVFILFSNTAKSEINFIGEVNVFYTSDVSIFSASRRLSLRGDPTQPFLETVGAGDDVVYEPVITAIKNLEPSWGEMELRFVAQGYVFTSQTKFNHGTYGIQLKQELPAGLGLLFRYHFGPNQFVGKNRNRRQASIFTSNEHSENPEEDRTNLVSERVTTHFGTMELEREIFHNLSIRALGRYGNRSYNRNFAHRNTDFLTIGTHVEWLIRPGLELMVGYHYERGLSDGRRQPQFEDDVSYINHYVSAEVQAYLTEKTVLMLGFDFEKNQYTANHSERRNGEENIYQGDIELRHKVTNNFDIRVGYQRAQRKFTFEEETAILNTFLVGSIIKF